jgi:protein-L-isoaspartate(D-aspartate) O-methyltransferase
VGTGSGYSTAVLSLLAADVVSIERHASLARAARETLAELGIDNVELLVGDGSRGLPERAPFEAIAVHATAPAPPPALVDQLAEGGRLVVPIAMETADMLTLVRRRPGGRIETEAIGPCRFVPLIGEEGF